MQTLGDASDKPYACVRPRMFMRSMSLRLTSAPHDTQPPRKVSGYCAKSGWLRIIRNIVSLPDVSVHFSTDITRSASVASNVGDDDRQAPLVNAASSDNVLPAT